MLGGGVCRDKYYTVLTPALSENLPTGSKPFRGFTLSPFGPPLQTYQTAATENRIEALEPYLDAVGVTSCFADIDHCVLLDSALVRPGLGRYSYVTADPFLVVRSKGRKVEVVEQGTVTHVDDNPFAVLKRLLSDFRTSRREGGPPFQGGAVGYFGYEMGGLLERLPGKAVDDLSLPDMTVAFYDWVVAFDHVGRKAWLITTKFSREGRDRWARDRIRRGSFGTASSNGMPIAATHFRSNFTPKRYLESVDRVMEYIVAGDIYQANISQRFEATVESDSWELYQAMRNTNPAPFGAYLGYPDFSVLSASPEQFLRVEDGFVETRPMKGTRPRGATPEEDARLAGELASSDKDRAENIMIVDLLRNDLGRVCIPGTILVPELFTVEQYPNVHQMVSSVTGKLKEENDVVDLLSACFPGGSVTGAPKIRAMEIIDEIEPVQRGVYCGAIGYIGFDGSMQLSIPIRTMVKKGEKVYLQVGGGIVADSDPESEYRETLDKARGGLDALGISGLQTSPLGVS